MKTVGKAAQIETLRYWAKSRGEGLDLGGSLWGYPIGQRPSKGFKRVVVPVIDRLPDDPEGERKEHELAKRAASRLRRFEE